MKTFFKDIFEYHNHFNQKLADLLIENKDRISERTIPLFSHNVNAHQIWNSRIIGMESLGINEVHTLEKCKEIDQMNHTDTLKILSGFDLDKKMKYKNSKGYKFENSIQHVLFHIVNHHTHHRGQIISDLRQNGIVPLKTDYIFYKR
ncbi:damage-inducible protein DinB [Galbibacter sp. EGI 63066]|uniref:DinB family protein n=1 Tax=Galbibacter sp. EGI 63066 TaxID=2993559 RepID=UPI0022489961|nr:DinB family protein [Galbibacter sp. EGI 63066]MCX2679253.1 damage-inducible protein DinB [Galbibacter sp. EGI 63066]